MQNVIIAKGQNGEIVITIDPKKRYGMSFTGKSVIVAFTGGFVPVGDGEVKINVTAIASVNGRPDD